MNLKTFVELTCPECGGTFKCSKHGDYYCSKHCYNQHYHRVNKYKVAEKRHERLRAKKYAETGSPLYAPKIIVNQALVFKD